MRKITFIDDENEMIISKNEYSHIHKKIDTLSKDNARLQALQLYNTYKELCSPVMKSSDSVKDDLLQIIKAICTFVQTHHLSSEDELVLTYSSNNNIMRLIENGDWDEINRIRTLQYLKGILDFDMICEEEGD